MKKLLLSLVLICLFPFLAHAQDFPGMVNTSPTANGVNGKLYPGLLDAFKRWVVAPGANTTWNINIGNTGCTPYHLVALGSTNATNVKATAGTLCGYYIYNNTAALRKVAFHDLASTPTAGTGIYFTLNIPAGPTAANLIGDFGVNFTNGIGFTTVTGNTDADATAVTAGDLTINLFYK